MSVYVPTIPTERFMEKVYQRKTVVKKFIQSKTEGQSAANLISLACDYYKEKALHQRGDRETFRGV